MKTFCVQLRRCERHPVDRFHQMADEWKIQDGFVMFTRHESEHGAGPRQAVRGGRTVVEVRCGLLTCRL